MKGVTITVTPFCLICLSPNYLYIIYNIDMGNKVIKTIEINDVKYDLNALPDGGDNGQVLAKRDDGAEWVYYTPKIWKGTLTEYAQIIDKDPECIYFIVENNINETE